MVVSEPSLLAGALSGHWLLELALRYGTRVQDLLFFLIKSGYQYAPSPFFF